MPPQRRPQTAEDGFLQQQSQALAEEEGATLKQEILTRFLKEKLAREKRNSTLNLRKLGTQWREVLREIKVKDLRQDVEILSQTFARVMDCKDSVIETLVRDLEEAEEQHARALRSHVDSMDRLLQLHRSRLACLEEGYSTQLEALVAEFEAERKIILEQQEQESFCLQELLQSAEQSRTQKDHEAMLNFHSTRGDIKIESLQETQYSRLQLSGYGEVLWEQFQRAMKSYTEATEHQTIAFGVLKEKDEKSSREIAKQAKMLQKLQDSVAATKAKIATHLRERERQNRRAREEKQKLLMQLQELKSEMTQARAKAHGRLTTLTVQSGAALQALAQVVAKAQRILRLAEMCRRLETEEEKVLPFYTSSLAEGEQQDAQRVLQKTPREPLAQALWDYAGLERFWQRFNKAKLEQQALERERAALSQRNQCLQDLAGVSITQDVLSNPSPLLIVGQKSLISGTHLA
ncbi:dynein regulatory complex subunit 2 [Podargus strigoides]